MLSRSVVMWIFVVLLILLAAPLLGALTTNSSVIGLATIWIALIALLLVTVAVSAVRLISRRRHRHDKAA